VSALARVLQVLTGDSWASGVARSIFQPGKTDAGIAFFFVSYILIASVSGSLRVYTSLSLACACAHLADCGRARPAQVMLMNVVVAILLDEFIATVTRAKEEADRAEAVELEKRKVHGCLDQLTRSLITFEDQHDLQKKIHQLYEHLDEVRRGLGAGMRARAPVRALPLALATLSSCWHFVILSSSPPSLGARWALPLNRMGRAGSISRSSSRV